MIYFTWGTCFLFIKTDEHVDINLIKIGTGTIYINVAADFIRKNAGTTYRNRPGLNLFYSLHPHCTYAPHDHFAGFYYKVSNLTIFIMLKIAMYILMHIATSGYYKKQPALYLRLLNKAITYGPYKLSRLPDKV